MLAEKFFLVLETLGSHASDGSVKVVSTTPHIPAKLRSPMGLRRVRADHCYRMGTRRCFPAVLFRPCCMCDQIATPGRNSAAVLGRSHACAQCRLNDSRPLVRAWSL